MIRAGCRPGTVRAGPCHGQLSQLRIPRGHPLSDRTSPVIGRVTLTRVMQPGYPFGVSTRGGRVLIARPGRRRVDEQAMQPSFPPLTERQRAILRLIVQEYVADRSRRSAPRRWPSGTRRRLLGDDPQRDGRSGGGRLRPAPAHLRRPGADRPRLPLLRPPPDGRRRAALGRADHDPPPVPPGRGRSSSSGWSWPRRCWPSGRQRLGRDRAADGDRRVCATSS